MLVCVAVHPALEGSVIEAIRVCRNPSSCGSLSECKHAAFVNAIMLAPESNISPSSVQGHVRMRGKP